VQVIDAGRISEAELEDLNWADTAAADAIGSMRGHFKGLVNEIDLFGCVYDSKDHILWKTGAVEAAKGRDVHLLIGMRLTEQGVISVITFARSKDFDAYRPTFERIVRDVELDDALAYKPRLTDSHIRGWNTSAGGRPGASPWRAWPSPSSRASRPPSSRAAGGAGRQR
jgi:hypothetical protein